MAVTRIETQGGEVLAEFAQPKAEQAWNPALNTQLVDMMRGVIDKGTGRAIRSQWGVRGKLAGKTGTTQGNADGWFILMQPQVVAGAWAGFNDQRITLRSDRWGQGAQSALPTVGDWMARLQGARLLDAGLDFPTGEGGSGGLGDWFADLLGKARGERDAQDEEVPDSTPQAPQRDAPAADTTQPWQGPASGESSAGMAPQPLPSPTPIPPGPAPQTTPPPPGSGTPVGRPMDGTNGTNGGFAPPVIDMGSSSGNVPDSTTPDAAPAPAPSDPLPPEYSDASPPAEVRPLAPLGASRP
jgi:penicillin-binding protein 1A